MDLIIIFDSEEIKFVYQEKAYPFWSFGAEVGGYVGMFLGYSIIQVPDLVNTAFGTAVNLYLFLIICHYKVNYALYLCSISIN